MSAGLYRMVFAITPLVVLSACAGAEAGGGPAAGLDSADRSLDWKQESVYALGGAQADGWAAFGQIGGVDFDGQGNLYILDSQANQVRVVAPDGTLLRNIGKPGDGPGELRMATGMAVFPDGTVVISDFRKFGMVVYGPDGEWVRDIKVDPQSLGFLSSPIVAMADRSILARMAGRLNPGPDATAEPGRPIVRVPLEEGQEPATILRAWEPPAPGEGKESTLKTASGVVVVTGPRLRAFNPNLMFAGLPDGRFIVVDSSAWRIEVHGADGTFQRNLDRPIPPTQTTAAIEEKERARRLASLNANAGVQVIGFGGGGRSVQSPDVTKMVRDQIEDMVFYPEIPVIENLAVDRDGRIWVQRASGEPGEPGPTDIITADGDYIGTLPADGLRTPRAFGPNRLAVWIEKDEFDADKIVVARIPGAG